MVLVHRLAPPLKDPPFSRGGAPTHTKKVDPMGGGGGVPYIYIYTYIHSHTYMHTYIHVCVCVYIYAKHVYRTQCVSRYIMCLGGVLRVPKCRFAICIQI